MNSRFPSVAAVVFIAVIVPLARSQSTLPATPAGLDTTIANLPAQKIGPDDLIAISVYNSPEFTRTARIGSDGMLRLPMMKGNLKAAGLMPSELEVAVASELKKEELLVDPFVTISMVEYHSRPISVMGAVKKPTTFQAIGDVTLLDALTRAEGLAPDAAGEILVSHPGPGGDRSNMLVQRVPVRGLIDLAEPELNLHLSGGEEIRVPEVGKIFVSGNVKRPGAFPVEDAANMTVMKALALAEGELPYSAKLAYIYRPDDRSKEKHEIAIELRKILDRKMPDVPLQPRDILYVPDNSGRRLSAQVVDRLLGFGSSTAAGVLIYRH
jgi:polysaccharide export outer membrane protein